MGFTHLDNTVIEQHFYQHYPAAIATAAELRERGGPERLVFMTHVGVLHSSAWRVLQSSPTTLACRFHQRPLVISCTQPVLASPAALLAAPGRDRPAAARLGNLTVSPPPSPSLQSWIASLFLDCPTHIGVRCPNSTEVEVSSRVAAVCVCGVYGVLGVGRGGLSVQSSVPTALRLRRAGGLGCGCAGHVFVSACKGVSVIHLSAGCCEPAVARGDIA